MLQQAPSSSAHPVLRAADGAFNAANVVVVAAAVAALLIACGTALSGCAGGGSGGAGAAGGDGSLPTLVLAANQPSAQADGISVVSIDATIANAAPDAIVIFSMSGVGLLSETNVPVLDGKASVELWAPLESDLTSSEFTSTVTASLTAGLSVVTDTVDVKFTLPTTGEPVLAAHSEPDRVVAGSGAHITVVVDGRRLTSSTVTIASDDTTGTVSVPASLTLDGDFHGTFDVAAPADPVDVNLTITADGAAPQIVALHFIAPDAPAFDLTGSFAQASYGGMELGNLVFLDPNPQCIATPGYALAHVVQTGSHIEITTELCEITMPTVNIVLIGGMGTHVGPGFVRAMNESNTDPLVLDLDDVGPGASWDLGPLTPHTIGAHLTDPFEDLPTSPDDPRVFDQDDDGNPGVTISGDSSIVGDNFTVSRSQTLHLTGRIESSDLVTGTEESTGDSSVLNGGSGGLSPTETSLPAPFVMVRVDGRNGAVNIAGRDGDPSSVSCDDVRAYEAELSAAHPQPELDCQ